MTKVSEKSSSSAKNLDSSKAAKKDATKGTAADLLKVILEYRENKTTAAKLVNTFKKSAGGVIYTNGMSLEQKVAAVQAAAERAKAEVLAAIDLEASRAVTLCRIPRGTTGKGGLHHSDVTAEMFSGQSKSGAIQNNTNALRSAGIIN